MKDTSSYFPLEASVLSADSLCEYVKSEYCTQKANISCRLFYRSINNIYRVIIDKEIFYFKVFRQGFRDLEEIQSEVELLLHLKQNGVVATEPIGKIDGSYVSQFKTVHGTSYGVLFTAVGLKSFEEMKDMSLLNEKLGSYIAQLHSVWDKKENVVKRWHLNSTSFIDNSMEHIRSFSKLYDFDIDFLEMVDSKTKEKVNSLTTNTPEYGVCHGDIYADNIRFDAQNNPVLFDFDFCGYGWRSYDISLYAGAFGLGCSASHILKREIRKEQFLNGYQKIRTMSDTEIKSIDLFITFRRIFNIGTIYIYMSNTWGDRAAISSTISDIDQLKKWIELNNVL